MCKDVGIEVTGIGVGRLVGVSVGYEVVGRTVGVDVGSRVFFNVGDSVGIFVGILEDTILFTLETASSSLPAFLAAQSTPQVQGCKYHNRKIVRETDVSIMRGDR